MTDKENITKFPIPYWKTIQNKRGIRAVHCIVSGRYLKYSKADTSARIEEGTPVFMDVMTDTGSTTNDKKLCQLIVTLEELKKWLKHSRTTAQNKAIFRHLQHVRP